MDYDLIGLGMALLMSVPIFNYGLKCSDCENSTFKSINDNNERFFAKKKFYSQTALLL